MQAPTQPLSVLAWGAAVATTSMAAKGDAAVGAAVVTATRAEFSYTVFVKTALRHTPPTPTFAPDGTH